MDSSLKKRKLDEAGLVSAEAKKRSLQTMLVPLSAEQLRTILVSAAMESDAVYDQILTQANSDPATRKLFVRGLAWETTTEDLLQVFSVYGEVEEGAVIMDKMTGKSKGFAFITFKNIAGANAALAEPTKQIAGRTVQCNLAALGPQRSKAMSAETTGFGAAVPGVAALGGNDIDARKLFVRGLSWDTSTETLLKVFSEFGEIEEGAVCMDRNTGKSRGFAFVTFTTVQGANAALSQEAKIIDGRTTHCNLAAKGKARLQAQQQVQQPQPAYASYGGYQQQAAYGQQAAYQQQSYYTPAATGYQMAAAAVPQQQVMMGMYGNQSTH